jgi:RNA polymerase sigma factor (sigma-70 family)
LGKKRTRKSRPSRAGRDKFPAKANPNRSKSAARSSSSSSDAWHFPVKCDPAESRAPLNEEQQELAARYLPMAESIAKGRRTRWTIERDELQSTAYLALVEAARSFDPSRNVNFATYARHHIEGALNDCRRFWVDSGWRGEQEARPIFQKLGRNPDVHGQVIGKHPELPVGTIIESVEVVEEWLAQLPMIHAWVCRLIYVYGMSQDEAAVYLGYSKSHFGRLHREAIAQLVDQKASPQNRPEPDAPRTTL